MTAVVLLGCAAVVASPISWPHHQVWLPLAALVLLGRRQRGPVTVGVLIMAFCVLHVPLSRLVDRVGGVAHVVDSLDTVLFVLLCLAGAGRAGTARSIRRTDEGSTKSRTTPRGTSHVRIESTGTSTLDR